MRDCCDPGCLVLRERFDPGCLVLREHGECSSSMPYSERQLPGPSIPGDTRCKLTCPTVGPKG